MKKIYYYLFKNFIDWGKVSIKKNLSEDFIEQFFSYLNFGCVVRNSKLSEAFLRKHINILDWGDVCTRQKLSESFILEFQDKICFSEISWSQELSEKFIEKNAKRLDWTYISKYQKLSDSFILKNKNKINKRIALEFQDLTKETRRVLIDEINNH